MPSSQPVGSTFTIRIDAVNVGPISHFGLRYIYNMAADYTVPAGTNAATSGASSAAAPPRSQVPRPAST